MTPGDDMVGRIDALLPQTQCGQCGFAACLPYAQAIVDGTANINRCPPGGPETLGALAALLDRPTLGLDPACGSFRPRTLALIDESNCIGCTLCIQACPVDAIVGAARQLHTVLADRCTGCELCLPPCPVDCIELVAHPVARISPGFAYLSKQRYEQRSARQQRAKAEQFKARMVAETPAERRQRIVAAAVAAARRRGRAP